MYIAPIIILVVVYVITYYSYFIFNYKDYKILLKLKEIVSDDNSIIFNCVFAEFGYTVYLNEKYIHIIKYVDRKEFYCTIGMETWHDVKAPNYFSKHYKLYNYLLDLNDKKIHQVYDSIQMKNKIKVIEAERNRKKNIKEILE